MMVFLKHECRLRNTGPGDYLTTEAPRAFYKEQKIPKIHVPTKNRLWQVLIMCMTKNILLLMLGKQMLLEVIEGNGQRFLPLHQSRDIILSVRQCKISHYEFSFGCNYS